MTTPNAPFDGLMPPLPPEGLRERALAAGRRALAEAPQPDPWTLVLESPRLRLAWAAAVLALAFAHALVPETRPEQGTSATPSDPELVEVARVDRLEASAPESRITPGPEGDSL